MIPYADRLGSKAGLRPRLGIYWEIPPPFVDRCHIGWGGALRRRVPIARARPQRSIIPNNIS